MAAVAPEEAGEAFAPSLTDRIESVLYRLGDAALQRLPLGLVQRVVAFWARRYFDLRIGNARWVAINLRIVYPEKSEAERREIGRESYVSFGLNVLDYVRSQHWSDEELLDHCPVEGVEHAERAIARGRGLLLLTLHMGCFEVGVQSIALALAHHDPAVLGRPLRNRLLYQHIQRSRTRARAELIDQNPARTMLRALQQKRPVGILLDRYTRHGRSVLVPLFGVRTHTPASLGMLAVRTGAPIVPCYVLRSGPDRHRAIFHPELEIERSGDRARDVELVTAACNAEIERIVRANPEEWMWGHRRFKQSPDFASDPYGRRPHRSSGSTHE